MKRYLKIYASLISFLIKTDVSYRFNFIIRLFYGPAYMGVLFIIIWLAFQNTDQIAGWNKDQAYLIYAVFNLLYLVGYSLFFQGVRRQLWSGINTGELDLILTKPLHPQFSFAFFNPNYEQFITVIASLWLMIHQILKLSVIISPLSLLLFLATFIMGIIIHYNIVIVYATSGFYASKAYQVLEFIDKATDYGSQPTNIFPTSIQSFAFTVIPIAYLGYVPVMFLLQKGSLQLLLLTICITIVSGILNKIAWREGLKRYSSASS